MKMEFCNMCMIHDKKTNKVVVLDKIKKYGWEGLTFPGGHVESGESGYDSTIREVFEETGLIIENLELRGMINWVNYNGDDRIIGLLYYTSKFGGELKIECDEGINSWIDLDEFILKKEKSDSMNDILKIYLDKNLVEVIKFYGEEKEIKTKEFRNDKE